MSLSFQAPKGTFDVASAESATSLAVREALAAADRRAGYGYIETPVFEDTALFVRGVGEATDIVGKEMYTFEDKGGRRLSLRPEGTAPVVRARTSSTACPRPAAGEALVLGPMFRYERMQTGRYRQFCQIGAEASARRTRRWTSS